MQCEESPEEAYSLNKQVTANENDDNTLKPLSEELENAIKDINIHSTNDGDGAEISYEGTSQLENCLQVDPVVEMHEHCVQSTETEELYSPSAPVGSPTAQWFGFINKGYYNAKENKAPYPDIISQISIENESNVDKISPYTEAELTSLYYNQELCNYDVFVRNFVVNELKSGNTTSHPLYDLLTGYLTSRDNLNKNELQFNCLIEDYKQFQEQIWNCDTSSFTEYGECQDGNPVSATHNFKVSHFNEYKYDSFVRNVNELEILTTELFVTNAFNVQMYQIKVEHFIQSLCHNFSFLPPHAPIQLQNESVPRGPLGADIRYFIHKLKLAVSVLFSFQRRPIKDDTFIAETRRWLEKLISVLLRVSTANDHLFITHHIMRCPAGVGKWASHFIQSPVTDNGLLYNQQHVDHLITTLAIILLPVEERHSFLQQMEAGLEENGMWVIVDSDGEDSDENSLPKTSLKENDLVSFLNQIPFADLFRQVLLVGHRDGEDVYDINIVTDRDVLRSIAIGTLLVTLLDKGIANYNAPVYKQFCKRLSRLMKHTASYITDHWQMFRETYTERSVVDSAMLNRLQTEYNEFFLRVVNSLYTTHDRIGWQYLATLPFGMITSRTLWRLYQYLLHTNNENDILMSEEFMENLSKLPDNDIYYFLTTITNMALNRQKQDHLFIQTIVLQLFQIGFVNITVRDKCMKPARILIANLTSKHPSLISDLIVALKKEFVLVGKFSLYLFKELPISLWKPNQTDYFAFTEWLLNCPLVSGENNLTRYIISQLNWSTDLNDSDLFLSRNFHCQIAILVVRAVYTYAEEVTTPSGTTIISQGVRQMSSMVRSQTPEQILNNWAWQTLGKLKLHLLDQPTRLVKLALTDVQLISQVPDVNADLEDMRVISNGISRNQSVAYYVALLMTNVSHSLPLICESCWDYCCKLLATYHYTQVLHILQLVVPYFFESVESLLSIKKFQYVIIQLLLADQTYMKMAKNLIKSDFPGDILSQFAALIQYHVENYSRYCLQVPNQMIELWLRILCSVWNENCHSVAYLMDKILSTVLTNDTLKQLSVNVLSELTQTMSTNKYTVGGSFSSLVSWIGYGGSSDVVTIPVSLLPRSSNTITHSPYFAFFALHLEEYGTQKETGLWTETLKILASTDGKANVDGAVKKACANLKLSAVSSNCLAIYRWSQYALEIPVDHPLLPLFWQHFFRLYLQRVPGNSTNYCIGSKFFEGTVNGAYFKKIKRKLQECYDYYTSQIASEDEEKEKYTNLSQLHKSFLFWLEEPRLQEPGLFLPALPATYNAVKLSEILSGNENPWLEYVDFKKINEERNTLLKKWTKTLIRETSSNAHRILCFPEDTNVLARILERLQSYDKRLPPPELVTARSSIPEIPREALIHKSLMLDNLTEHFHTMVQFTKGYEFEKSEQNSAACKLLEALRQLYVDVDMEVKLSAFCDVAVSSRRRTVSTINCAGPAQIKIQIREARLNKVAERTMDRCDVDFQRLLRHNVRKPSVQLSVACVVIELAAECLQEERAEVVAAGDVTMLNSLQDVGVALFYKVACLYDSQISEYFPTKLFVRRVVDILGQGFINEVENECARLLSTLINSPKLSVILVPYFTPSVVSASTFVHLYRRVTEEILKKPVDLILDVITKFNVKEWLKQKSPRFADRSQLIEVLSHALRDIGAQPSDALLPVHKILRRDLCEILVYDFPEHYGEILHVILKYSAEEKFSCDVWFDILNALLVTASTQQNTSGINESPILYPGLSITQIRDIARRYASELRTLSFIELVETANLLGNNFLKERLQYGLYGLYPKYCTYLEPIIALHSMVGHSAVTTILYIQRGALADKICEQIWPVLMNLFSPWIIPYRTSNLHEPVAPWIQQLTDDRSVLLPWVATDVTVANKMMASFMECLKFILDALPATSVILSNVCQWYIENFAHQCVKEHILTVVQTNLITLGWSRYIPTLADLECILKVVDQYLPACHSFLGSVFIEIPWNVVIKNESPQTATKVHIILLHLLIKLANEPNLRQNGRVRMLLLEAQQFNWHLIDAANYENVLNWFVMSYDSRVILLLTDEDWNGIDTAAFDLLQVAAGYVTEGSNFHPTTLRKKQMFVKAGVRMTLQLANRYKTILAVHHSHMESTFVRMLDRMENVVTQTVPVENRTAECALLLSELLVLVNQPTGSVLPRLVVQVILNWLTHRAASSPVLQGLLQIINTAVTDQSHLGVILEACLTAWFRNSGDTEEYSWDKVIEVLQEITLSHPPIEDMFVSSNQILSLYAFTLKHLKSDGNILIFSRLVHWITCIKPSNDNESKLPLLWSLVFNNCSQDFQEITPSLLRLCNYFQQIINMKSGWALFGVIGMNKQPVPSLRCKVLCYAINAFILVKLSEGSGDKIEEVSDHGDEAEKSSATVCAECIKAVSTLEALGSDKHYTEYRVTIDYAVRLIKATDVPIGKGEQFIITLAKQLYTEGYIHAFQSDGTL